VFEKAHNLLKKSTVNFVGKLIALVSCAANGFGEMELGREREKKIILCD
jgi:hypothetical protein